MNRELLQNQLAEIEKHLIDFKEILILSEDKYQKALRIITDPDLKSLLMENHFAHTERQKKAIDRMTNLYEKIRDQLAEP